MDEKFLKPYNPAETEDRIYRAWEESGFLNPDGLPGERKESFSIVLPPPNVTGVLHIGHAEMLAVQDILVRFNRMRGKKTLWLPGTDHAAIATQSRVESDLYKQEKKHRHDLGREEFLRRVEAFAKESHDTIVRQLRKMGSSLDWSREAFTLDEKRSHAVREAFTRMYNAGLIYRGRRIVNWDPKMQTTVSDEEIEWVEEIAPFYYLKYGPFTVGTSRPETKFGDKYVVMHPADTRYGAYEHGQKLEVEWLSGPVTATVIKDEAVDREFGTGVMTITPWHDSADFDIAKRHNLAMEQVIDDFGKLLPIAGEFAGMKIAEARPKVVEKLAAQGLLERVDEHYTHRVAHNSRGGGRIEPQVKLQWFVDVNAPIPEREGLPAGKAGKTLKELMREPVERGDIRIVPDYFGKTYFHWIDNLRDWCISRQIWYGHRVPVWYRKKPTTNNSPLTTETAETYVGVETPEGEGWEQDPDTLDTWFSSGLWTFSTLGWPDETEDLKTYHPTSVLETGYDILFFWVARMILMSEFLLGTVPFHTAYLHGLVRDAKGRKMSKSLGNIIDPVDMIEKYGADAVRLSLIVGQAAGTDSRLSEDKIRGYKHFANKLWNIARFVLENTEEMRLEVLYSENDQRIWNRFQLLKKDVTKDIEGYRVHMAAEKLYHYTWHQFADMVLEHSKTIFAGESPEENGPEFIASRKKLLYSILVDILKLLHPFTPFVTEEIWSCLQAGRQAMPGKQNPLMVERWPV